MSQNMWTLRGAIRRSSSYAARVSDPSATPAWRWNARRSSRIATGVAASTRAPSYPSSPYANCTTEPDASTTAPE